ncbi:DUF899 domain-containing protein [Reyranella sp.]|uniref:DUF899 domain-containing protein n=1 Tax=Reyranella sp. TaxID=1929291 RepID=UPI003D0D30DF
MTAHVVSHQEWLAASRELLAKEKEFTRLRDELSRQRRELPWERVDQEYSFEAPEGRVALADLFSGHSQLLVYHLMFGPDWTEACKSCSFWADNFNGVDVHLAHRDTALVAVSRAPLATLEAYAKRMGWTFRWVSSGGGDFNFDYKVSSRPGEDTLDYNFGTMKVGPGEMPGFSAFRRGDDGAIYHTYSTYARGVDMLNGAYHLLDLTSKGRDESGLPFTMSWVKRRDQY